jgi:hypothetical protein
MEGRLEVIEAAAWSLESLERLLQASKWPEPSAAKEHLQRWLTLQPQLQEAMQAAQQEGVTQPIARLKRVGVSLNHRLKNRFRDSAIGRAATLEERLRLWMQLLQMTAVTARSDQPLAEASMKEHQQWWLRIMALAFFTFFFTPYTVPAVIALLLSAFGRRLFSKEIRYRLFQDVIVREKKGEPTLELPLTSFEQGEARPGHPLIGFLDLNLEKDERFNTFCARLNQLKNEHQVLRAEQRVLERFNAPPGRWLTARIEPVQGDQPESAELVAMRGTASPSDGQALLCDRGLLFIPHSAEAEVRSVLFNTEGVELMRDRARAINLLPESLILERLGELRRVAGVRWCDVEDPLTWVWVDDRESVELQGGRLSVTVDEASRAELRQRWGR